MFWSGSEKQEHWTWTKLVVPDRKFSVGSAFVDYITDNSHGAPTKGRSVVDEWEIKKIVQRVKSDRMAVGIIPHIPLHDIDLSTKWSMRRCGVCLVELGEANCSTL